MARRLPAALLLAALLLSACGGGGDGTKPCCALPPIEVALASAPQVVSSEEATASLPQTLRDEGYRLFRLEVEQPTDHLAAGGGTFRQFASLLWKGYGLPVVFATSGYGAARTPGRTELTALLGANQLAAEHRFFQPSAPDPLDWSKLTIQQAAADHHRIVESLKPVLGGRWISAGASKGGMTAVYHRRFYPDDVDGTVAYVAPTSTSTSDPAYVTFLEGVGTAECRQKLEALQRAVLAGRAGVEAEMTADALDEGDGFQTFGVGKALDYVVVETSFLFWQYGAGVSACAGIPGDGATGKELADYLGSLYGRPNGILDWIGDAALAYYAPYYHQSATQLGGPAYPQDHLLDLLPGGVPADDLPERYPPLGVDKPWDAAAMPDVSAWVTSSGERLLFVYGENDPWSSRPYEPSEANDAFRYLVPAGNHGANITRLPEPARSAATAAVRRWAGLAAGAALTAWPVEGVDFDPWALHEGERGIRALRARAERNEAVTTADSGPADLDAPARGR